MIHNVRGIGNQYPILCIYVSGKREKRILNAILSWFSWSNEHICIPPVSFHLSPDTSLIFKLEFLPFSPLNLDLPCLLTCPRPISTSPGPANRRVPSSPAGSPASCLHLREFHVNLYCMLQPFFLKCFFLFFLLKKKENALEKYDYN